MSKRGAGPRRRWDGYGPAGPSRPGRPPKTLDPASSSCARLGAELRRLRHRAAMTQAFLADLTGYSAQHVGAVERGDAAPSDAFARACDAALGSGGHLSALVPEVFDEQRVARHERHARRNPRSESAPPQARRNANGPDVDWERMAAARGRPTRLGGGVVEDVELITDRHRHLYHGLSSAEMLGPAGTHLGLLTSLLNGDVAERQRRILSALAAETAGLVAWLWFDLGECPRMERHYRVAQQAVADSGDRALGAYILGFRAIATSGAGKTAAGRDMLGGAAVEARHAAVPTMQAWLAGLTAQHQARASEEGECFAALREAERALGRVREGGEPPWMFGFDHARLAAQRGSCFLALRRPASALHNFDEALNGLDPQCTRRRGRILVDTAYAHLLGRRPNEAGQAAAAALALFAEVGSVAGLRRIRRFSERLGAFGHQAARKELEARMRSFARIQ